MEYPSFSTFYSEATAKSAQASADQLQVEWSDGRMSRYHTIFLRDHAPDENTFDPRTREHNREADSYPEDLSLAEAEIAPDGHIRARFMPEDFETHFDPAWLRTHDYSNNASRDPAGVAPTLWDKQTASGPPRIDGTDILTNDATLKAFVEGAITHGLSILENTPTDDGTVLQVARRIGIVRASNFGEIFDVRAKQDPDSNAYTGLALFPHTDLSTREYEPGLQFLHCLENTVPGGQAVFIDGYKVAEDIRNEDPALFADLTTLPWNFTNRAKDTDYRWQSPIIVLDPSGGFGEIRFTSFLRAPLTLPFDDVPRAYAAMQAFCARLRDERYRLSFAYKPGDLVLFDNRRVLHGRAAYEPGEGSRWLQGCYGEREELLSRLRVLLR